MSSQEQQERGGQKRSYSGTYRRSESERRNVGTMYTKTPIINDLPPVGSEVKVFTKNCYVRAEGDADMPVHVGWYVESRFQDWQNRAASWKILEYIGDITNPLDSKNYVILARTCKSGHVLKETIKTLQIVSGNVDLRLA